MVIACGLVTSLDSASKCFALSSQKMRLNAFLVSKESEPAVGFLFFFLG